MVPQLNGAPSPRQTPELDVVPGNGQVEEEEFVQDDVQDTGADDAGADDAGDSGAGGGDGGKSLILTSCFLAFFQSGVDVACRFISPV